MASDGRWYPPETWTGAPVQYPGAVIPGYPSGGPGSPYSYVATQSTNGFAVASLVCACSGVFFLGIPSVIGIIFGFIARGQIKRSGGRQGGGGLALAGIIVGFAVVGVAILLIVLIAVFANDSSSCNTFSDGLNCTVN
jgi:hypothetical protein